MSKNETDRQMREQVKNVAIDLEEMAIAYGKSAQGIGTASVVRSMSRRLLSAIDSPLLEVFESRSSKYPLPQPSPPAPVPEGEMKTPEEIAKWLDPIAPSPSPVSPEGEELTCDWEYIGLSPPSALADEINRRGAAIRDLRSTVSKLEGERDELKRETEIWLRTKQSMRERIEELSRVGERWQKERDELAKKLGETEAALDTVSGRLGFVQSLRQGEVAGSRYPIGASVVPGLTQSDQRAFGAMIDRIGIGYGIRQDENPPRLVVQVEHERSDGTWWSSEWVFDETETLVEVRSCEGESDGSDGRFPVGEPTPPAAGEGETWEKPTIEQGARDMLSIVFDLKATDAEKQMAKNTLREVLWPSEPIDVTSPLPSGESGDWEAKVNELTEKLMEAEGDRNVANTTLQEVMQEVEYVKAKYDALAIWVKTASFIPPLSTELYETKKTSWTEHGYAVMVRRHVDLWWQSRTGMGESESRALTLPRPPLPQDHG